MYINVQRTYAHSHFTSALNQIGGMDLEFGAKMLEQRKIFFEANINVFCTQVHARARGLKGLKTKI
jgi:hypothetical protein